MAEEQLTQISVIDPVSPAIERVKLILFRPFDFGKWFAIGFCAWLAILCQGGFHCNFPFGNRGGNPAAACPAQNFFTDNFVLIIILGSIIFVFGLAVMILCLWLSSRGHFMFLHCVAKNKAEVKAPWHQYRQQGNSLFLFRLSVAVIFFICMALLGGTIVLCVLLFGKSNILATVIGIASLVLVSLIMAVVIVSFLLIFKFTRDFVIPIMYLRAGTCVEAWRQFLKILLAKKGAFALYLLFQIVISMAISAIVMAAMLATCCCAACIMIIPYIGTVLMLPMLIFKRSYSLYYLRQFDPQFDVFIPEAEQL